MIPFAIIDEVPIYKGCETLTTNKERKSCLNKMMRNHIVKNFNTDIVKCLETELVYNAKKNKEIEECINVLTPGIKRIYIQFKIGITGEVEDINVRAPHPKLKEEGIRITKLIPALIPGKQKGNRVRVGYTLPISFKVE